MLLALATAALLQVNVQVTKDTLPDSAKKTTRTSINIGIGIGVTRYDTSAVKDSIRKARRAAMAIPVTPELARTAFAEVRARPAHLPRGELRAGALQPRRRRGDGGHRAARRDPHRAEGGAGRGGRGDARRRRRRRDAA